MFIPDPKDGSLYRVSNSIEEEIKVNATINICPVLFYIHGDLFGTILTVNNVI